MKLNGGRRLNDHFHMQTAGSTQGSRIIGRKFVEVSEKPQVTRQRIRGTRAFPTVFLVGNARPTEMTATATKKRRSHEDVRAPLALRVWREVQLLGPANHLGHEGGHLGGLGGVDALDDVGRGAGERLHAAGVNTGDGDGAHVGAHRRRGVGTAPLVLRLGKTNVQVSGDAGEAPHHAAVRSARIDDALAREHGELAGADGINVDHKRAANLLAVLGQEGLHARVAEAAGTQAHEPDVVAEKSVVVHGQYGVAQVLVGGGCGAGVRGVLAVRGVCGGDNLGGRVGRAGHGSLGGGGGLVLDEPQAGAGGGAALPAAILVAPVLVVGDAEPVLALVVGLGGALVTKRQVDLG